MKRMLASGVVALLLITAAVIGHAEDGKRVIAGYDGGFVLRSAENDHFELKLGTRMQFQDNYEHQNGPDTHTFKLRRARLNVIGKMFEKFGFLTIINHGTAAATPNTTFWVGQMYANLHPAFNLTFGHVSLPFDRMGEKSSGKGAFIEAPLTAVQSDTNTNTGISREAFGAPYTLGINVTGDVGPVSYGVGIGHGSGYNVVNSNNTFQYAGRLMWNIMGKPGYDPSDQAYSETPQLGIGAGVSYDPQDAVGAAIPGRAGTATLDSSLQFSGDVAFKWKGLSLITEAYMRKLRVSTGSFTQDDVGYYTQASYFVLPKRVELAARASQIFREGPNNNSYEFGGAVNWYIHGHNVKWQNDFTRVVSYDPSVVSTPSTNAARVPINRFRSMLTFQI